MGVEVSATSCQLYSAQFPWPALTEKEAIHFSRRAVHTDKRGGGDPMLHKIHIRASTVRGTWRHPLQTFLLLSRAGCPGPAALPRCPWAKDTAEAERFQDYLASLETAEMSSLPSHQLDLGAGRCLAQAVSEELSSLHWLGSWFWDRRPVPRAVLPEAKWWPKQRRSQVICVPI